MVSKEQILPLLIIVISAGACIVYSFSGDWRHGLYWGSAVLLGISVTF
jgi:hypothetical protein